MLATLKQRLGDIVNGVRRHRLLAKRGSNDDDHARPSIYVGCRSESSKSRGFAVKCSKERNHDVVNTSSEADSGKNLPLLFCLARSWAWEAVSFRCTTHPNEVQVNYRDEHGDTCLHWIAFGRPPVETVRAILSVCPELARTANHAGTLPLHVACSYRASPLVIQEILRRYPEAAAIPDGFGATPLHHVCDYGSGDPTETIASIKMLLRCPSGIMSVLQRDHRYHRRPLYIINARKNIREQERYLELMRDRRFRQRAIRNEMSFEGHHLSWNEDLQMELIDRFEDDIQSSYRENSFWFMASLLVLAEYYLRCTMAETGKAFPDACDSYSDRIAHMQIIEGFFGMDGETDFPISLDGNTSIAFSLESEKCSHTSMENNTYHPLSIESIMLQAFITSEDIPPAFLEYAVLLFENQLMIPSATCRQQLPLHVAASRYNAGRTKTPFIETISQLLTLLLEGYPNAASFRGVTGSLPLNLILKQQRSGRTRNELPKTFWSNGFLKLIEANPEALLESDVFTKNEKLRSHVLARLCQNKNAIYAIFRANPSILAQAIS